MAQDEFFIAEMQSLSVEGSGKTRSAIVPRAAQPEGFKESYDWTTLWYDALADGRRLRLICPKLLNFRTFLADGALKIDGQPARIRRTSRHRRHDIVEINLPEGAERISTRSGRWQGESGFSPVQTAHFAGLNASLHISRNNRLDWIEDWARFHVSEHGLEAMLLMDNASDAYPPEAILDAMARAGLKRGVVLKVPQTYGPVRSKTGGGGAKFLQPAMLNHARLRFLSRARAVLNADIDEIVWSQGGSVFDAAVESPLGLVAFEGCWTSPRMGSKPPFRHGDHLHPEVGVGPCPTKYCIRPDGWRRHLNWDVHRPGLPFPIRLLKRADFGYWHCRAITTNWKAYDRLQPRRSTEADPFAAETFARLLPQ